MALLWLPGLAKDDHGHRLSWSETTDPKGCLHTTEGSGWPTYSGWSISPHGTIMPIPGKGVTGRQHVPLDSASFSLKNEAGGVQTNRDYVWQWELIGTCDPAMKGKLYFWPEADDAVLLDLARKVILPLSKAMGIPLKAPTWKAYPSSYGRSNVRMSGPEYDGYSGWLGHQHVPENSHGDPGAFPWARLMKLAATLQTPTTPEEDMPLTPAEKDEIADLAAAKVLATVLTKTGWQLDGTYDGNKPVPLTVQRALTMIWKDAMRTDPAPAPSADVDPAMLATALAPLLPTAEQIADVLARRLAQ